MQNSARDLEQIRAALLAVQGDRASLAANASTEPWSFQLRFVRAKSAEGAFGNSARHTQQTNMDKDAHR